MEYEKFVDYLKSQLELDMCDQNVTAERTMINKLNQDRDVLALRNPDSCITPVVYLVQRSGRKDAETASDRP